MKTFLAIVLFISIQANAQIFKIDTTEITYENKLRPCLSVDYDANADFVKKYFKDYCKEKFDVKIKGYGFLSNADILIGEDVTISNISDKRINIYNRILETPSGGSTSKLFISFGYDFFVDTTTFKKEFANMFLLLNDFSTKMLMSFYTNDIEDMNKRIKKVNRDSRSQESDIKKYTKRIGKSKYSESEKIEYSGKIDVAKQAIENNNKELITLKEKIKLYNKKLTTLINSLS